MRSKNPPSVGRSNGRSVANTLALAVVVAVVLVFSSSSHTFRANALGTHIADGNRTRDEFGRLTTLRYLHVPKTGTSFIIALRNYLTKCKAKDYSCQGWLGGSVSTVDKKKSWRTETCDNHLTACQAETYHLPWLPRFDETQNVVTLLRDPLALALSGFSFHNQQLAKEGKEPITAEEYLMSFDNPHTKMLAGHSFLTAITKQRNKILDQWLVRARRRLFNETVFYGITEFWNATICLFHKELNGPGPSNSEYLNVRKTKSKKSAKAFDDDTIRDFKGFNIHDTLLYLEAKDRFLDRAKEHGCMEKLQVDRERVIAAMKRKQFEEDRIAWDAYRKELERQKKEEQDALTRQRKAEWAAAAKAERESKDAATAGFGRRLQAQGLGRFNLRQEEFSPVTDESLILRKPYEDSFSRLSGFQVSEDYREAFSADEILIEIADDHDAEAEFEYLESEFYGIDDSNYDSYFYYEWDSSYSTEEGEAEDMSDV